MPAAAFYAPLDTWTEAAPTFTQKTAALKILGGDADVDNFLQQTYADPNDLEAVVIESRAKAVAHKFSDTFFNGDTGSDANSFDGLVNQVISGQEITAGANGAALTLDMVDELIDTVKPGRPEALLMAKRTQSQAVVAASCVGQHPRNVARRLRSTRHLVRRHPLHHRRLAADRRNARQ